MLLAWRNSATLLLGRRNSAAQFPTHSSCLRRQVQDILPCHLLVKACPQLRLIHSHRHNLLIPTPIRTQVLHRYPGAIQKVCGFILSFLCKKEKKVNEEKIKINQNSRDNLSVNA